MTRGAKNLHPNNPLPKNVHLNISIQCFLLTQSLWVGFDRYYDFVRASWLPLIIVIALAFDVLAGELTWVVGPSKGHL